MFCSSASLVQTRAISTRRDRLSAVIIVDATRKHSRASSRYFSPQCCICSPSKRCTKKAPNVGAVKSSTIIKFFRNQFHVREFVDELGIEEGTMWLTLASIVLASAIGFNVLALWLTGYFERKQPEAGT